MSSFTVRDLFILQMIQCNYYSLNVTPLMLIFVLMAAHIHIVKCGHLIKVMQMHIMGNKFIEILLPWLLVKSSVCKFNIEIIKLSHGKCNTKAKIQSLNN